MAEWLVLFSVIWLVRKKVCCTCQGFFFFLVIRSAYHLYGKPGNSGENSNGTVYPGGNFPGKKIIPFEVLLFSRFCRNNRNILYHFFVLPVPSFKSRESEKFTCIF